MEVEGAAGDTRDEDTSGLIGSVVLLWVGVATPTVFDSATDNCETAGPGAKLAGKGSCFILFATRLVIVTGLDSSAEEKLVGASELALLVDPPPLPVDIELKRASERRVQSTHTILRHEDLHIILASHSI